MDESTGLDPALVATPVEDETGTAESTPAVIDANVKPEPDQEPVQKRIDKLTWQARQAERDRDYWRDQAQRQQPAPPAAEPEKPKAAPTLEAFNYDEAAYQAALTAHVTAEAARQVREEFRKEQEQLTQKQRVESWRKRETEFAAKTPDYKDKAYYAPIPDKAVEIIRDCESGPAIAYYLGNHPEEARALDGMSEAAMARAIGRIEAKLEAPAPPAPAPKPVSKAPPPPPKIEATDSTPRVSTTSPESDKLSDDEWVKAEKARLSRKVKRNV
jgi:hypothetical protein